MQELNERQELIASMPGITSETPNQEVVDWLNEPIGSLGNVPHGDLIAIGVTYDIAGLCRAGLQDDIGTVGVDPLIKVRALADGYERLMERGTGLQLDHPFAANLLQLMVDAGLMPQGAHDDIYAIGTYLTARGSSVFGTDVITLGMVEAERGQ